MDGRGLSMLRYSLRSRFCSMRDVASLAALNTLHALRSDMASCVSDWRATSMVFSSAALSGANSWQSDSILSMITVDWSIRSVSFLRELRHQNKATAECLSG